VSPYIYCQKILRLLNIKLIWIIHRGGGGDSAGGNVCGGDLLGCGAGVNDWAADSPREPPDLTIVFGGRIVGVLYRIASILLLFYFLGLGTGTWEFLHERQHEAEDARVDAVARAMHLPVAPHHHDEANCEICAAIHVSFVATAWVPLLICLGLFVAFLTLLDAPLIPRMVPARIDCRGPPGCAWAFIPN